MDKTVDIQNKTVSDQQASFVYEDKPNKKSTHTAADRNYYSSVDPQAVLGLKPYQSTASSKQTLFDNRKASNQTDKASLLDYDTSQNMKDRLKQHSHIYSDKERALLNNDDLK